MDSAVLHIFPTSGLDQSILPAVVLGVLVIWFFTETFGWVFVGLVVPGYLASVFIIQPASGVAIVFESLLTYLLAVWLAESFPRLGAWTRFFGRERFFLILLVSVIVRQQSQLWLLPAAVEWIDSIAGTDLAIEREFFSIGLVLVPLTANMFWKRDLVRGSFQIGLVVFLTWLVLEVLLLPTTNLSFNSLALAYENVAVDFLASPKVYIILLTGAYLAAHLNLRFGWDYNGILVPSLLALTWFVPLKLAATIGEVLVVVFMVRLILRLPAVRTWNTEGPRKLVLVMLVGFLVKYAMCWWFGDAFPGMKATDLFGFGYVLPSLLAVKIVVRRSVGRVMMPTLAASLATFVVGSLVAFGLHTVFPAPEETSAAPASRPAPSRRLSRTPLGAMVVAAVRARPSDAFADDAALSPEETTSYGALWDAVGAWLETGRSDAESRAQSLSRRLGYALTPLEETAELGAAQAFALVEENEELRAQRGFVTAILVPERSGPVLVVSRPRSQPLVAESAVEVCRRLDCTAILAAGRERPHGAAPLSDHSMLQTAIARLGRFPVIGLERTVWLVPGTARLELRGGLPPALDLGKLAPLDVELVWPGTRERPMSRLGFAGLLQIHPRDLLALLVEDGRFVARTFPGRTLLHWVDERREDIVPTPATLPTGPASETEQVLLEQVLVPGLLLSAQVGEDNDSPRVRWLNRTARLLLHEVTVLPDCLGKGRGCTVLCPTVPERGAGWLLLAARHGPADPTVIEVPRPYREAGTLALGGVLWEASGGFAMAVRAPLAPGDQESNPATGPGFIAAHRALHRHASDRGGEMAAILQVRGFTPRYGRNIEAVLALDRPILAEERLPDGLAALFAASGPLAWLAEDVQLHRGSWELLDLGATQIPEVRYASVVGGAPVAVLWFSQKLRRTGPHRSVLARAEHLRRLTRVGIGFREDALVGAGVPDPLWEGCASPADATPAAFEEALRLARAYATSLDMHTLVALARLDREACALRVSGGWSHALHAALIRLDTETTTGRANALVRLADRSHATLRQPVVVGLQPTEPAVARAARIRLRLRHADTVIVRAAPDAGEPADEGRTP